jgi:hypothetical protein
MTKDLKFESNELVTLFENIRAGISQTLGISYVVFSENGDTAQIICIEHEGSSNEWRFFIDNFPGQKKYYQTNFPYPDVGTFISDMKRIGIELKLKPEFVV